MLADGVIVDDWHPVALARDVCSEPRRRTWPRSRSDRAAIAYRRWLGQLGLTFGTA